MNPPISGQNTWETYTTRPRSHNHRRGDQACSATCSLGDGNAHATCCRRSWRNTNRNWLGGLRPSGWAGRNVAHGRPSLAIAHKRFWPKKHVSQLALPAFATPFPIRDNTLS